MNGPGQQASDGRLSRIPAVSIALVSGTALAYEILLLQLFSQVFWHHFAFLVISIALLGTGASGTLVTVLQQRIDGNPGRYYLLFLALLAGTMQIAFPLAQRLPFNPLELTWSPTQLGWLALMFLLLALPFLTAGSCISMALRRWGRRSGRIYGWDLCGAAAGAALIVWLMTGVFSGTCLRVLVSSALVALLAGWIEQRRPVYPVVVVALMSFAAIPWLVPDRWMDPRPSQFKSLAQSLRVPLTEIIARQPSPLGEVTVTDHRGIPLRYAPGLSILSPNLPPSQLGLFVNGDIVGALAKRQVQGSGLAFLDWTPSALAYHLMRSRSRRGRVLVLDAAHGQGFYQALYQGAGHIVAVEPHKILAVVAEEFPNFSVQLPQNMEAAWIYRMPRAYLSASREHFNLIAVPVAGTGVAGAGVLKPQFDYTREAVGIYWRHLTPDGLIAFEAEAQVPPRTSLKLLATFKAMLTAAGVSSPQEHLAMIRSWDRVLLLISRSPFSAKEVDIIRRFCRQRAFDPVYFSGLKPFEANRYNRVAGSTFFNGAKELLGQDEASFTARYKFDLQPVTDSRPYLFHQLKLSSMSELLGHFRRGGEALLEWSYPLLLGSLVITLVASTGLIMLPLSLLQRRTRRQQALPDRTSLALYFIAIGLGYLFLEIAMINQLSLHLGDPLLSVAAVLTVFLLFSGIGSLSSEWLTSTLRGRPWLLFAALVLVALATWIGMNPALATLLPQMTGPFQVVAVSLWLAPLGLLLGMPFPLAVHALSATRGDWVPWVWAVNGCASVVSPILATILALQWGIPTLVYSAALLYLVAGYCGRRVINSAI